MQGALLLFAALAAGIYNVRDFGAGAMRMSSRRFHARLDRKRIGRARSASRRPVTAWTGSAPIYGIILTGH